MIGTLARRAEGPVDVVTSDRDLFQVVDDERDVRVVYTGRGMRKLELVTDGVAGRSTGSRRPSTRTWRWRGDPSDGLPGVAGIGEKTAGARLLATATWLAPRDR